MSKIGYIARYSIIINKLSSHKYCTYQELENHIERELNFLQTLDDTLNVGFSKRTFERDKKEIRNIFQINIEYSASRKGYYIEENEGQRNNIMQSMEYFEVFNSLQLARGISPHLLLENRKPQGTENLPKLIHAIKKNTQVRFRYQKFSEGQESETLIEPYALKEFKYRWYLIGKDCKDNAIKRFALDRLFNLEITKKTFDFPENYDIQESYRHCFGIINPENEEPQEIILAFSPFQGKYIKTLPLHESQQILVDNEQELRIRLYLRITHDFVMEILSHSSNVKVLAPEVLIERVKNELQNSLNLYL
jgi:predicted DNA-binding transcriptional regulator YafY